jgi:predicted Na+-dependent transporter
MNTQNFTEVKKLQQILKIVFVVVPIVAGLDKFTNILTDWTGYLSPNIASMLPISTSAFMMIIGVIEIAAGVIVLFQTRLGAYIVAAWLILIALNLIVTWNHADVAVRDLVMAITAFTLAKLTEITTEQN